ncbi:MAG: DUF4435 domain-containing protein [Prevotella sp.]|nr:DUF4435 domain-containing protein [Prevotella sp.]MDE6011121.1 DUF4435 domain-containing protein [Prevotella sp.]
MSYRLKDNINSRYFEAANALKGKTARQRIVAYVESYDDIYFWRTVLNRFEDEQRYFEVMLPSKGHLSRGKKSVLMNFLKENADTDDNKNKLGPSMIACVDADYDFLVQGVTPQSRMVINSPYVFHTYVYAIENFQCYAPSLHDVCVAVTLNDHRIIDFNDYFQRYSEACFPLFVWSVWAYRTGNHGRFSLSDFNRVTALGGFTIQDPDASIANIRRKVQAKVRELQRIFPDNKNAYLKVRDDIKALGVTPQTTYLYMQGHHIFDGIVAPILTKVCNQLRQERESEIYHSQAHKTQKRNELSCYENSQQDVKSMLKKNTAYQQSSRFQQLQNDIRRYLDEYKANVD